MSLSEADARDRYPIVPLPQRLEPREGAFVLDARTRISLSDPADDALRAVAEFFAGLVRFAADLPLPVADDDDAAGGAIALPCRSTPTIVSVPAFDFLLRWS